ncbi:hypothetical protein A3770_08p52180 [Chloropicon primus]|uniref:DUF4042 domain-containing protein n=1 Tax=Chloropicon primus TaxID=1764295 RepID=A0A5B8MTF2_9CHLO|nr:hypothetical protein A3770_08p52180 [Chloropicon primus]|eukprot:QDZ22700.1 hypothetical protein A3770_08p52180 [Chloropicon primus]
MTLEALVKQSRALAESPRRGQKGGQPNGHPSPEVPVDAFLESVAQTFSSNKGLASGERGITAEDLQMVFGALSTVLKVEEGSERAKVNPSLCSSAIIETCRRARGFPEEEFKSLKTSVLKLLTCVTTTSKKLNIVSKKELLKLLLHLLVRSVRLTEDDVRTLARVAPVFMGRAGPTAGTATAAAATAGAPTTRYVPPHRRGSDSDVSDSELEGSRARSLPYLCLQCLECIEAKQLQPYFIQLFEVISEVIGDEARSKSLRTIAAKVATKMLEGTTQRSYLAIAELPQASKGLHRGFTTLPIQLGRLLTSLHSTFRDAMAKENSAILLSSTLRALGALIAVSPYDKLEPQLAPEMFGFLFQKFHGLVERSVQQSGRETSSEEFSVLQNAANCFSLLISKKGVSSQGNGDESLQRLISAMATITCNDAYPSGVRLDTSISLQRFAKALPGLVAPHTHEVYSAVKNFLRQQDLEGSEAGKKPVLDEKICQQAIRVLSEMLPLPQAPKDMVPFCEEIMLEGMVCKSSLIRSAVLQSITHLKSGLAENVDAGKLEFLVTKVCYYAGADSSSSIGIRSSACRALGALLSLEPLLRATNVFEQGLSSVIQLGSSDSGTLQVSLAWSLANVCDFLREQTQHKNGSLGHEMTQTVIRHLPSIASLTMRLAECNDKIKCNAVRCIGYIFDLCATLETDIKGFTGQAVDCILTALRRGNTKSQWNCCYAAGSFFKLSVSADAELISRILTSVTSLMKSSVNYKVLSHAISALSQLERSLYPPGRVFDVCDSLIQVLLLLDRQKASSVKEEDLKELATQLLMACIEEGGKDDGKVVELLVSEKDWLCTISEEVSGCLKRLEGN